MRMEFSTGFYKIDLVLNWITEKKTFLMINKESKHLGIKLEQNSCGTRIVILVEVNDLYLQIIVKIGFGKESIEVCWKVLH